MHLFLAACQFKCSEKSLNRFDPNTTASAGQAGGRFSLVPDFFSAELAGSVSASADSSLVAATVGSSSGSEIACSGSTGLNCSFLLSLSPVLRSGAVFATLFPLPSSGRRRDSNPPPAHSPSKTTSATPVVSPAQILGLAFAAIRQPPDFPMRAVAGNPASAGDSNARCKSDGTSSWPAGAAAMGFPGDPIGT